MIYLTRLNINFIKVSAPAYIKRSAAVRADQPDFNLLLLSKVNMKTPFITAHGAHPEFLYLAHFQPDHRPCILQYSRAFITSDDMSNSASGASPAFKNFL